MLIREILRVREIVKLEWVCYVNLILHNGKVQKNLHESCKTQTGERDMRTFEEFVLMLFLLSDLRVVDTAA